LKILTISREKRRHLEKVAETQYGISDFFSKYELLQAGDGKIRATTRQTLEIAAMLKTVHAVGLYVAKARDWGLSLSIEGSQLLCGAATKNIVELDEQEARLWMTGSPVSLSQPVEGKLVVGRFKGFCIGTGVVGRDGKAYPQVPKWRRIPEE